MQSFLSTPMSLLCMQVELQQLVKSVTTSGATRPMVKSTLVLVLRDVPMPVDKCLPPLREKFTANFCKTFQKAKKPQGLGSPSFDDCFQAISSVQSACECSMLHG